MSEQPDDAGLRTGTAAEIGVIGGSGFYALANHLTDVVVDTPYGPTSAPISVGEVAGRRVAFVARHGREHQYPPHRVPYRANLWALHSLGVRQVLAPCAVGSLRPELGPGSLVIPDQLVDRTSGRASTYFDGPVTHHASFADPFCAKLRTHAVAAATAGLGRSPKVARWSSSKGHAFPAARNLSGMPAPAGRW